MAMTRHQLTLPDGGKEDIPPGITPIRDCGTWRASNRAVTVQSVAEALAQAERECDTATARASYLRGLMGRVLDATREAAQVEGAS